MADIFPQSGLPIRRTVDLLPQVFKTETNAKFLAGSLDPLVQPGVLEKTVGYVGRRFGKTYNGKDIYLDSDKTLRSRYQLEPGVVFKDNGRVENFYDYLDFKNQIKFFNNNVERDDLITSQDHYSWNPPVDWDKFINFREYYWVPEGPPSVTVLGQGLGIISTYRVRQGITSSWIFFPDGATNNPTITLYRGQTYKFQVNSPREGFTIRTAFDTGSLIYNPNIPYAPGQLAIFDGQLWRAKNYLSGSVTGSIVEGPDWELVDENVQTSKFDYFNGVTNNGITNGTVTFEVPLDAPDVLFYQSTINADRFGRFIIADVESNTRIDVEKEIIGKETYTSSNDVAFTNGLMVRFAGQVTPAKYAKDVWLVENVGKDIRLIKFSDLEVPIVTSQVPEVIFDNAGFDTDPFDDASSYPGEKDYVTICRASIDSNPWSRYNRWFHKSTLEYAHKFNNTDFESAETARAKRPIIEFISDIQLFNHGSVAKAPVDFIDDFTDDVFSKIEGSQGYSIDGQTLFQNARILITADTDILANNKIYRVDFITHNGVRQIALRKVDDSEPIIGEGVLVKNGNKNKGLMFHYTGLRWIKSQPKTQAVQPPLFDLFDENGMSFSQQEIYPASTFVGNKIISYQQGNGIVDSELGFSLKYLNIDNVGDILFNFDFDTDAFLYSFNQQTVSLDCNKGYFRFNPDDEYDNGWIKSDPDYLQPLLDSIIVVDETNSVVFETVDWKEIENTSFKLFVYVNGNRTENFVRDGKEFVFEASLKKNDVVSLKLFCNQHPDQGYYQIPLGLEKNPFNERLSAFTLGQVVDHISTALELDERFIGLYPGNSNLRDLDNFQNRANRFTKHSGIAPMAVSLLCDKNLNIIKSIQYSLKLYTQFKNEFLKTALSIDVVDDVSAMVDNIILNIGVNKNTDDPFGDTDMIGSGAFTSLNYEVEDEGIKVFALSQKFDLETLSRRAVYIYLNQQILVYKQDYTFDSTFGFVRLSADLDEGDRIEIREYVSTAFNYIPCTPTKLGLFKKYLPGKFVDDTYVTPREVIQGHDGSITTCYGDYRDDLLLELELRIYNNIKQEYNESIFNIDEIIGGYYGNSLYGKKEVDDIVNQEFLKWIANSDIDFTDNTQYFDRLNSFTYTYSNMTDISGNVNLPGYWRGVYHWIYDTVRPHTCPWEIQGFSEKPDWWESQYGTAPYTSGNLLLWEDIRDGIIRQGIRAGTYPRYARPTILSHIPVDGDGNLLSPLDSGFATNYTLVNNNGKYNLGDLSPAEYAWRSSSEYPFAIIIALTLLKPFEFITDSFDRSILTLNKLGQTVSRSNKIFFTLNDLVFPEIGGIQSSGLVNFIVSYVKNQNLNQRVISDKLNGIDVALSTRISGFVDQTEQKYLLDSKNPRSTTSSIFIPPENYDIIFNVSVPITSLAYSGVLIEKRDNGWRVRGYDNQRSYFNYFQSVRSTVDPLITVGGVSAKFRDWATGTVYNNGDIVRVNDVFYQALRSHTAGESFESQFWKKLAKLPLTGGVDAFFRRSFSTLRPLQLSYGTVLNTIQDVVDFLLGYEQYLKSQGMFFEKYDTVTQTSFNWSTSAKEFMFWTKHNWAAGSLLTLSPAAQELEISIPVGVADSLFDPFYEYEIYKSDGTPLLPGFINVSRDFQKIKIGTVNTNDGIFFIRVNFVLKEHVTIFDDRTVFNDVIYDKTTGYRQERIKSRGFRTVDWDGDYTSPGFLFDNVNIQSWQPFLDYRLGDIVSFKSFNWVSKENQEGRDSFDNTKWEKLDSSPTKGLVPNFDYRINQFEDYFDVDADGLGSSQRELSRHVLGYQAREYLQNLAEDNVSQFKIYQGFIREKGTINSIIKIFDKLNNANRGGIDLYEEWAFRVGTLGGTEQFAETEFKIFKDDLLLNPQPILIGSFTNNEEILDQYLRVKRDDFTISPVPFTTNIIPTKKYEQSNRTPGYVNFLDVDFIVANKNEILELDIAEVPDNSHIWVTFDNTSWTVLRVTSQTLLFVTDINENNGLVTINLSRPHNLNVDDIFGIRGIINLQGFFKVVSTPSDDTLIVALAEDADPPEWDSSTISNIELLVEARITNYQNLNLEEAASLKSDSKLWVDKNKDNNWEVVNKQTSYVPGIIDTYGLGEPKRNGTAVIYSETLRQTISSMPLSNAVGIYAEREQQLKAQQILLAPTEIAGAVNHVFGESLAISPDGKWLAVGSPRASGIKTVYREIFDPASNYSSGDIVLYKGRLWRAIIDIVGDGSTGPLTNQYDVDNWELCTILTTNVSDDVIPNLGYATQGVVTLYEWANNTWNLRYSFVSPRQQTDELFGSKLALSSSDGNYYMAVSAPGSLNQLGRVYLFKYGQIEEIEGETITYIVRVGPPLFSDTGVQFYLNDQYRLRPDLIVGNTYVFDQSDLSNLYYPNPVTGTNITFVAGDFIAGRQYQINSLGDTDWISIGVTPFATFIGSITGNQLTITSIATPGPTEPQRIVIGQQISGVGIISGTTITGFVSGSFGDVGVYTVSRTQLVSSGLISAVNPGQTFTATGPGSGSGIASLYFTSTNPQPLTFIDFDLSPYSFNVTYILDNRTVTRNQYISGFNTSIVRKVQIVVTDRTDNLLYYVSASAPGSVNPVFKKFPRIAKEWKFLENENYKGVYQTGAEYNQGDIVWYDSKFWAASRTITGDASTIAIDEQISDDWKIVSGLQTQNSLPTKLSLKESDFDDVVLGVADSTLSVGLVDLEDSIEKIKEGDRFGTSIAMNRDGSVLVVGAPFSDATYYASYKGVWRSFQEYVRDDVVKHEFNYYVMLQDVSVNEAPASGGWSLLESVDTDIKGKVFVYRRENDIYKLFQTINAGTLDELSDIIVPYQIASGDQFGWSLDVDANGSTIVVSSPLADLDLDNQGSVYVFRFDQDSTSGSYRLKQKLQSYENYSNESFGFNVRITDELDKIVVSSRNTALRLSMVFDASLDNYGTTFNEGPIYVGQVYVFELKDDVYVLAEKLQVDKSEIEDFGFSIDAANSVVVVGSPNYSVDGIKQGITRLFRKNVGTTSWNQIREETTLTNIDLLKSLSLFDDINNTKLADIDIVDGAKFKILGRADQEIKFKTPYDPAVYTNGNESKVVDPDTAWFEKQVGMVWWDISRAKWLYYEQDDVAYRSGNWNSLAYGATIEVYEWVESRYSPSDYSLLADTSDGLAQNISGQPVFGTAVFSYKEFYNPSNEEISSVRYYFWVKNKTVIPNNVAGRNISVRDIASLIENPIGSGLPFVAFISSDKLLSFNFNSLVREEYGLLNFEFYKNTNATNLVHKEYQLLVEGVADSLPAATLEQKWIDSLVGSNAAGNPVPDARLPEKQRYGIQFRPAQTMFVDQQKALKIVIDNINSILVSRPFSDLLNFEQLTSKDSLPDPLTNRYDLQVDTIDLLSEIGVSRIRPAAFSVNIINGRITGIQIEDPGFGYRVSPPLIISGDGIAAKATCTIDSQGRINSVSIVSEGRKYNTASVSVRNFSVLISSDSTINGYWAIYSWNHLAREWSRTLSQSFDVSRYWSYKDWYAEQVTSTTRIAKEIVNFYLEPTVSVERNEIVRIKEFANGGWALLQKVNDGEGNIAGNYNLVGRENGTIEFSSSLYDIKQYDKNTTYDELPYESQPSQELRILLDVVKNDIFVDDLRIEWNKLFFTSIRYIFSEQLYVDWAFKTSFINAIHNVGTLEKKTNYKSDNLESFQQYIEEVKPFRTTIREYTSRYTNLDDTNTLVGDFDLPSVYEPLEGKITTVDQNSFYIDQFPWKLWKDNQGYSIVDIDVFYPGENYRDPPRVIIEGDGTGASAKAFISSGRVSGIRILDAGTGYTFARISLVGGNGSSQDTAKAYAILGQGKARSLHLKIRFDRITKTGIVNDFSYQQEFAADGFTSIFNLNYPPTRDKSKINVFINGQLILDSDYSITFYKLDLDTYSLFRGKLSLSTLPNAGDNILITYEKNDDILDSVDRINKYYSPRSGMLGKELNQLMTGIDFGGVQIQGTTFDISGGWDALPWFTDNWDNVETNSDFYYATGDSAVIQSVNLPNAPDIDSLISIYLTRNQVTTRIDDLNFGIGDGSTVTNPNAQIATFVGDGSSTLIDIFPYVVTQPNDILIFRPIESDGTLTINDVNIIDTNLAGGSLSSMDGAYVTANGMFAEDIVVDGGKFINPDYVPATEENIPGQFLDSVSIKLFHTAVSGAAPLKSMVVQGDGETSRYDIGQTILDTNSLLVYVDKIKQGVSVNDSSVDYEIDYIENQIVFKTPPEHGSIIEIISIGVGGIALLDYQEFVADGETSLYLTKANFTDTESVLVIVNGVEIDVDFVDSTDLIDVQNRTMIQFPIPPENRNVIKIIVLGTAFDTDSGERAVVRVNQQSFVYDGSTTSFDLDRFVNLSRASSAGAMLVEVNGKQLTGVDTEFVIYDGTNNVIKVGVDPVEPPNSILSSNLKVYVNNVLQRRTIDYVFDSSANTVTVFVVQLQINDEIKVEVDLRSEYEVIENNLVLTRNLIEEDSTVNIKEGDVVTVIWFSEYPSMNLIQNQYSGGKNRYQLERIPVSASFVWIYKNGERLTQDIDYQVSLPDNSVYLKIVGDITDEIKIVEYGNDLRRDPVAFEIYKDMFNSYQFKRFAIDKTVYLTKELTYYDTEIEVSDTSGLFMPLKRRNIPGVIIINNERIEYFEITRNKLRHLRRGSVGSAIAELHTVNSSVVDVSRSESLPYNEEQEKYNFISDGSTLSIGPLSSVPKVTGSTVGTTWYRNTTEIDGNIIYNPPLEFGRCDEIEVFVGGTRLRKDTVKIYNPDLSVNSVQGDQDVPAEFTVDGITPYIRLTNAVSAGTRITVIKKTGKTWYDRGATTISSGKTLFKNESPVLKFISQNPTELPE